MLRKEGMVVDFALAFSLQSHGWHGEVGMGRQCWVCPITFAFGQEQSHEERWQAGSLWQEEQWVGHRMPWASKQGNGVCGRDSCEKGHGQEVLGILSELREVGWRCC